MLRSPSSARRNTGRLLIVAAVAVALPLTASRAIAYVDVPASTAPVAPVTRVLPVAAVQAAIAVPPTPTPVAVARPVPAAAPVRPASDLGFDRNMSINEDYVTIDGKRKRWEDLTPAEKARVREAVAKARTALANTHIDQAKLMRDIANLPDKARMEEMQRDLAGARAKVAETLRKMDEDRASGQSDQLEAAVRDRLDSLRDVDFEAASRALANIDRKKIESEVAGAKQSVERAKAQLERIQAKIDSDQRH
jgi:hypothetical protein